MTSLAFIKYLLVLFLNYLKAGILTWVVVPTLFPLFVVWTAFSYKWQITWLKYFSFISPKYATETFTMNEGDVMKIFGIVSLVFFLTIELLEIFKLKIKLPPRTGLKVLSVVYGVATILVLFPTPLLSARFNEQPTDLLIPGFIFAMISFVSYFIWSFFSWTINLLHENISSTQVIVKD